MPDEVAVVDIHPAPVGELDIGTAPTFVGALTAALEVCGLIHLLGPQFPVREAPGSGGSPPLIPATDAASGPGRREPRR